MAATQRDVEGSCKDDDAFAAEQRAIIEDWSEKHLGVRLAVTASKDFDMVQLWDDRAVTVETNTGRMKTIFGELTQPDPLPLDPRFEIIR